MSWSNDDVRAFFIWSWIWFEMNVEYICISVHVWIAYIDVIFVFGLHQKTRDTLPKFSVEIWITSYKNFTNDDVPNLQDWSSKEQKYFWLGSAPPLIHRIVGAPGSQHGWEWRATHEPWVEALPSLVPSHDTLQAEGTMDTRWLRRHRVLRRWRHNVRLSYSCRNVGRGSTNLRQSGKSVALVFSVLLHTNTHFMSY